MISFKHVRNTDWPNAFHLSSDSGGRIIMNSLRSSWQLKFSAPEILNSAEATDETMPALMEHLDSVMFDLLQAVNGVSARGHATKIPRKMDSK